MWYQMFLVPFSIGIAIGFLSKGYLNRRERRKRFNKHMDELFNHVDDLLKGGDKRL